MRIITWNCNMAFRRKAELILKYEPDILIIPECEHPDKLKFRNDIPVPHDILWFGANPNKGLGIFSYCDLRFRVHKKYEAAFKMIVPVIVSNGKIKFTLYAIWANNPADRDGAYVTQIWKALQYYGRTIRNKETLLAGDFNSNTIWDRPRRKGNHSTVVQVLNKKGIDSVYHQHFKMEQGKEAHPTLYMYRQKEKPYHIDYCFASRDWLSKLSSVEVGEHAAWAMYSDHMPVIVDFQIQDTENTENHKGH